MEIANLEQRQKTRQEIVNSAVKLERQIRELDTRKQEAYRTYEKIASATDVKVVALNKQLAALNDSLSVFRSSY